MSQQPDPADAGARPARKTRRPVAPPTAAPILPDGVTFENDPDPLVVPLLKRAIDRRLLAAMANAPPDADAHIAVDPAPDGFQTRASFVGGHATRVFLHHAADNVLEAQNWDFRLNRIESADGTGDWGPETDAFDGTELFTNQVRALRHVGFHRIWTVAARTDHPDPNVGQVGYCVWPKMGFDAALPDEVWEKLPPPLRRLVESNVGGSRWPRGLLALVATREGSEWWRVNGIGLECTFALDDGSASMRVLAAYVAQRTGES